MIGYVSISQILRDCVSKVSDILLPDLQNINSTITGVHFRQGHYLEVTEALKKLSGGITTDADKWPMVALFRDFNEETGQPGFYSKPTVTLLIATVNDDPNMTSDEREQKKFIPILYPIYFELLNQLYLDARVSVLAPDEIPHRKIDHYFYGSNTVFEKPKSVFGEWTDSIELQNLELTINEFNC